MGNDNDDLGFAIILLLMLTGLGVWLLSNSSTQVETIRHQTRLFVTSIAVRFLGTLVLYVFGLSQIAGDEDSGGYYIGRAFYGEWKLRHYGITDLPGIWLTAFTERHQGYYYLVGSYYFVTESIGRIGPAVINCFFGAMTAVLAYRVARLLYSNWSAVRVGWAVCFIPSMIIWSCQTLKEPVVIFLEMVALYSCVMLRRLRFSLKYIVICGMTTLVLYPFRFYASLVTGIVVLVTLVLPEVGRRGGSTRMAGIVLAAFVLPLASSSGMLARSEAEINTFDAQRIQKFRRDVALEGSGVETQFDMTTTSGFVLGTLVGVAHLALAPFPWQMGVSLRALFNLPEMIFWWWIFFYGLIPGLIYVIRNRFFDFLPALIFILALGLLYSMMFGNVGLIFRQRAQLMPWLLIFCMLGWELKEVKKYLKKHPVQQLRQQYRVGAVGD